MGSGVESQWGGVGVLSIVNQKIIKCCSMIRIDGNDNTFFVLILNGPQILLYKLIGV